MRVATKPRALALVLALLSAVYAPYLPEAGASPAGAVDVAVAGDRIWSLSASGRVDVAGGAQWYGDVVSLPLNGAPRGITATPSGRGYWIMGADGGVFTFGDAGFFGSTGSRRLNAPVISMSATPSGRGYWLLASDGGVFSFGDARFYGSTGAMRLNSPVVGMAPTPTGRGYWLVASDGGIFSFGDARFYGSTGAMRLNAPVNDMASTPTGRGYWLAASDGGVFSFGDARFRGSAVGLGSPVVAIAGTSGGYVQQLSDGRVIDWPSGRTVLTPTQPPTRGPHAFIQTDAQGRPARWDACRPVRIEVNYANSYTGSRATLTEAVQRLRAATGLDVRIVGETSAQMPSSRADMVIVWNPMDTSVWGLAEVGWAEPSKQILLARVQFNSNVPAISGFGTDQSFGNLALHELAHAVGLDHVVDLNQVMYPVMRPLPGYANGDREGLWRVGSAQGCFPRAALAADTDVEDLIDEWITIVD